MNSNPNPNLTSTSTLSQTQAILGATIKADTVDGKMDVKIPAGTQPEQKLRLRGKGVPKLGTDVRGDQYITVKVRRGLTLTPTLTLSSNHSNPNPNPNELEPEPYK